MVLGKVDGENFFWTAVQLHGYRKQTYQGSANKGVNFNGNKIEQEFFSAVIHLIFFIIGF